MNVVGRVGSIISQGVYSVATPFHPFGGAVDIIVVEQPDGSYRSTPWYVRFGKFQGVLKGAEKVVTISVNGVDTPFHMFLDSSGQAYFMREVAPTGEDSDGGECRDSGAVLHEGRIDDSRHPERSKSDGDICTGYSDRPSSPELNVERQDEQAMGEFDPYYGNLEEIEDLVKQGDGADSEMVLVSVDGHVLTAPISSTEENTEDVQLSNPQFHLGPGESSSGDFGHDGEVWEAGILGDFNVSLGKDNYESGHQLEGLEECKEGSAAVGETRDVLINQDEAHHILVNEVETCDVLANVDKCRVVLANEDKICESSAKEGETYDVSVLEDNAYDVSNEDVELEEAGAGLSKNDTFKSCLDLTSHIDEGDSGNSSLSSEFDHQRNPELSPRDCSVVKIRLEVVESGQVSYDRNGSLQCLQQEVEISGVTTDDDGTQGRDRFAPLQGEECYSTSEGGSLDRSKDIQSSEIETDNSDSFQATSGSNDKEKLESIPENPVVEEELNQEEVPRLQKGLGFEIALCGHMLQPGMGRESAENIFQQHLVLEEDFKSSGPSIVHNPDLVVKVDSGYFHWSKISHVILGKAVFGPDFCIEPMDAIPVEQQETSGAKEDTPGMSPSSSRRWRLWPIPFRRSMSLRRSNSDSSTEDLFLDTESVLSPMDEQAPENNKNQSPRKQLVRTLIPTNEQIASLNLKEGQNMVTFTFCTSSFSTRVLGKKHQVDAHIYLWKWNAKIVISDVDGTITRSDVLGQVMPLVGRDWSQSGVARLFSAIKENGYQLLFLSARAIVQAYLTRNFLFNLKQDGKALPSGPVVISPDGLFPSLYREVIRRAPHEFKIACLEDIKALFPSDYNPFYAGFGNRDTDELSYKKIGIPQGKIFIINPKGEVAINSRVHVKSYTSLHTLVNDMFPPTSLVEQEDYNSWNYWRMPLPEVDL